MPTVAKQQIVRRVAGLFALTDQLAQQLAQAHCLNGHRATEIIRWCYNK